MLVDLEKDAYEIKEDKGKPQKPGEEEKQLLPRYDKTLALKTAMKTLPPQTLDVNRGSSADADRRIKWAYIVDLLLKI